MITNFICDSCSKQGVCKNRDILIKFHKDSKKPLGVDITMDECQNFEDGMKDAIVED